MTLDQRIRAFSQLGEHLQQLSEDGFQSLAESARMENPWFTPDNIRMAITGVHELLREEHLRTWTNSYTLTPAQPKTVSVVMAGNIPLVGFHDFLCALMSGNRVQLKFSSKDSRLLAYIIKHLIWLEPEFETYIEVKNKLENFDAIIATGSDNSARYFEYYFGKYPNIIRKNRTSCALITGFETPDELALLGTDILSYFGLGCRNVSKLFVPVGYDITTCISSWNQLEGIIHHHKYCNNYDYQKSILLVNQTPHLDNGFVLLQENEKMVSPIAVLYYEYYTSDTDLDSKLSASRDKLQCIVGNHKLANVSFGQTQFPKVWDYADQIDTLRFLDNL
jgi:hypothetical protein